MTSIKTILVDDENHCIERLSRLLADHSHIEILDTCQNLEEAQKSLEQHAPDLLFLDVHLHNKTGFDLLKAFDEPAFEVVFTTAYDKYAIEAIKFSAIDYLLKPIDKSELADTINRVEKKVSKQDLSSQMNVLLNNLEASSKAKKIAIPTPEGMSFIQIDDIIHCQADTNYTRIYLSDKRNLIVSKTLKTYEELLESHGFMRVHHSHLINLAHVEKYNKGKTSTITLSNQAEIEIATRRKDQFLKRISGEF